MTEPHPENAPVSRERLADLRALADEADAFRRLTPNWHRFRPEAGSVLVDPDTVRALCDIAGEVERLRAEMMRVKSQRLVSIIFGLPEGQACAKPFGLYRHHDVSGVSGEGKVVAHGVEFPDGTVALRWVGGNPTSVVFHDNGMESVEAIHGHGGNTEVIWYAENITTAADEERLREQAEAAHAALVADLRALHRPSQLGAVCLDCDAAWPCPTVAALDRHAPEEG